jgi:WhiB family redox-sensing transcriptional regulator
MTDQLSLFPAWHAQAACRGVPDPDIFFPHGNSITAAAIRLCESCQVRDACRQDAIDHRMAGIWGGTTRPERRAATQGRTYKPQAGAFGQAVLNAQKTHCKWNHEFTPENTRWSHGKRVCVACYERRLAERRAANARKRRAS